MKLSQATMLPRTMLPCLVNCISVLAVVSLPCDMDTTTLYRNGEYVLYPNNSLLDFQRNILYRPSQYWETETKGVFRACVCQQRTCIRKCCPERWAIVRKGGSSSFKCAPSNSSLVHPFALTLHDDTDGQTSRMKIDVEHNPKYFLLTRLWSCSDKFILDSTFNEAYRYLVLSNGNLRLVNYPTSDYNISTHCLEARIDRDNSGKDRSRIVPLVCFPPGFPRWPLLYAPIVSIPFLLITFLVFACVQKLRNYHGKSLMCHVSSLMAWFVLSSLKKFGFLKQQSTGIWLVAFILQFSQLAVFFWLNAMCFDVWWTFSGRKTFKGAIQDRSDERTKFIVCSMYAWGCPLLICSFTAFVEKNESFFPNWLHPRLGLSVFLFNNPFARILYLDAPCGILLLLNLLMFLWTALTICRLTRQTAILRRGENMTHYDTDRRRFFLYLKLFVLMGAGWSGEAISWFHRSKFIYVYTYILSMCNSLMGVFIFILFVCNSKTLTLVRKWICTDRTASNILGEPSTQVTQSAGPRSSSSVETHDDVSLALISSNSRKGKSASSIEQIDGH